MGCCLTSWFSKKQTTLAISITEAEYVSTRKACQQALWMKLALIDYGISLYDIPIMCDNKGAIELRPDIAPRHRHASKRRSASLIRLVEDPQRRRKDTWDLIQSYVTSSSERQREIKEEWDAADHASRMPPALTKELRSRGSPKDLPGSGKNRAVGNAHLVSHVQLHAYWLRQGLADKEAVKSGQLSHLVKEIKQGGKRGEQAKAAKKGEAPNKEMAYGRISWSSLATINRQENHQSLTRSKNLSFSPLED
ncbi:hypothetical protein Tco_1046063 [Tanacetum coccineum]